MNDDDATPLFVLIPGAGGSARYWYLVEPELRRRGHRAVAVDLPAADDRAGLAEYTAETLAVISDEQTVVVVAQSMGAFTGLLVCEQRPVDLLVLVNAMIPLPGETGADWWVNTGHAEARIEQARREGRQPPSGDDTDILDAFFHDVPPDVAAEIMSYGEPRQASKPFTEPWPLARWPAASTKVLQGSDDRFFPVEFQRQIARERLGIELDEIPGGHLIALSQPVALVDRLEAYWFELRGGQP